MTAAPRPKMIGSMDVKGLGRAAVVACDGIGTTDSVFC